MEIFPLNGDLGRGTQPQASPSAHMIRMNVNGVAAKLLVEPWYSLLDALRDQLGLTGTKRGCDHGQCGACTVLVNGRRINSCLALAVLQDGSSVTTIEGLGQGDQLGAMQEAFVACDAYQCGFCTPGQICSAIGLMAEGRARTPEEIREMMSGNLCRCGAYPHILQAIETVMQDAGERGLS